MVKRPKTPETDVTGKLLIIFKPYPNADCLVEEDKIALARWVAEIINKDHIVTIWNRPNTQSLIMVEILKETDLASINSFLGEHRWAEFLKNPRPDEMDNVSQVFYSAYSTDREAQKKGWKQVDVQDFWFDGFRRGQGTIKQPYPETRWCPVPPNTSHVTAGTFCRPLPVGVKPPPPPVKAPVPGSQQYFSAGPNAIASGESSSGPSSVPGTPLTTTTPTLPESWPVIGKRDATKKPAAKPAPTPAPNAPAGNGAGGKKKGVKVGLAEFTTAKKPAGQSSWNKVTTAAPTKAQGPIASKDPPPSSNPPKERINAWGAPALKTASSSYGPSAAPPPLNRLSVSDPQSGTATPSATDQAPKKARWGDMPSKPYKPKKSGGQPKADDDAPHWSSVKSRQHSGNGKGEKERGSPADSPTLKWSEYEDDDLPELPAAKTNEETKDEYDPWAAPSDEAAPAANSGTTAQAQIFEDTWGTPSPPPAKPSTIPQSQVYEEIWGDNAVDSGGGAGWITKGGPKGKRGRGRGNNNFGNGERERDGGRGGGDIGAGKSWAPKSGPDSRGTAWDRARGRGRGAKPMFENRQQRNDSWGNKGKQKAEEDDEEQQDAEAQRNGGNSGSSGRSSPGPAQARWVPDAPPHVQVPEEGSSTGLGATFTQNYEDTYDQAAYWGAVEPIAETTEDIYASFANALPVENEVRRTSSSPGTPATPLTPLTTTRRTPAELQEEFDKLYKDHCTAEKRRIEQIICTTHHIVCKKGVCKDIAKIIRVEQNKVDANFKPPAHLRHLVKGKGGKRQGWNRGDFGGQRRAQQDGEVAEDDERQRGGRSKAKTVDGYQVGPSASDW